MHECGEPDGGGQSHGQILAEWIGRGARDPKPQPAEESEERHYDANTDEAPLFPDRAEQEIRVGVGEIPQLLLALAEAHTEQLTRPDADQRLMNLEPGLRRGSARVQEGYQASQSILHIMDLVKDHQQP